MLFVHICEASFIIPRISSVIRAARVDAETPDNLTWLVYGLDPPFQVLSERCIPYMSSGPFRPHSYWPLISVDASQSKKNFQ